MSTISTILICQFTLNKIPSKVVLITLSCDFFEHKVKLTACVVVNLTFICLFISPKFILQINKN